jgi:hypothetical protein
MSGRVRGGDARHRRRGMRGVVYGRGVPVFGPRPEAASPRPQPDGSAGHDRTRNEGVSTQEADPVLG